MAVCTPPNAVYAAIFDGVLDQQLTPIPSLDPADPILDEPRLTPDGSAVYVRSTPMAAPVAFAIYLRQPDGSWRVVPAVLPFGTTSLLSTVAHAPDGDHVIEQLGPMYREWIGNSSYAFTSAGTYQASDFGVSALASSGADLSADGLRLIFLGSATSTSFDQMFYADRDAVTHRFGTATPLVGVPAVTDAFMTDDCARVYFHGLQQIFYAQQQ